MSQKLVPTRRTGASPRIAAIAVLLLTALATSGTAPSAARLERPRKVSGPTANFKMKGTGVIRLAYKAFDPLKNGEPRIPSKLRAASKQGAYGWWLVQLRYPIRKASRDAVLRTARRSAGYLPEATYVVELTPALANKLRALRGVRWVGLFHPAYKLRPRMAGSAGVLDVTGRREFHAYLFKGENLPSVLAQMRGIPGVSLDASHATSRVVPFRATRDQLAAVARLQAVNWVAEKPTVELHNYNARWASDTGERDAFYATLAGRLNGANQTAAVVDTGVSYVTDSNGRGQHAFADFSRDGTTKLADYLQKVAGNSQEQMFDRVFNATNHRKVSAYYDLAGDGYEPSEATTHGTHTGGTVVADYPDATGRYGTHNPPGLGADGFAPAAHLIVQDVAQGPDGSLGGLPPDYYDMYEQVYDQNPTHGTDETNEFASDLHLNAVYSHDPTVDARTHNYSIGSIIPLIDLGQGERVDAFVHDHEDFVIVASASNDGPGLFTMPGGPQSAKNGLTSCASANGRQPMVTLDSAAIFSSHGLTPDMRLKPDVCTPGQIVVSPKGGSVDEDHYAQGTSMSGPVLTGLATLVRQYFFDGFGPAPSKGSYVGYASGARNPARRWNPSAALVKSVLINSAERMRGFYTGDDGQVRQLDGQWPSAGQGWGRVELENSLYFTGGTRRAFVADVWNTSPQALEFSSTDYEVQVTAGEPLNVTLTWSDRPSGLGAGTTPLVNNLDLTVIGPDGTTYVGNNFTTQGSLAFNSAPGDPSADVGESRPGSALPDKKNNVEGVRLEAPTSGTYTIHIDGGEAITNPIGTADGKQGYALVATGLVGPGAKAPKPVDESVKPTISNVVVTPVSADMATATWETDEPTTGALLLTDASGTTTRFDDVHNPSTFPGLETPQNENAGDYLDKKVIGRRHEVRLTGLTAGAAYTVKIEATDLAATPNTSTSATQRFVSTSAMFQPRATDIAQLSDQDSTGKPMLPSEQMWGTSTQLYSGLFPTLPGQLVGPPLPPSKYIPAFMFRLPAAVDPSRITGAAVELTSGHDWVNKYTQDARLRLSLLDPSVEEGWGPGTGYETIANAPADARVAPDSGDLRGSNTKYVFSFACTDLDALKQTLSADRSSDEERAAFRVESSLLGDPDVFESLFSFETGFGRRSRGPELRPRLLLQIDGVDPQPCANTSAPSISDVQVHEGSGAKPTSVVVSWRTDVPSTSMVLYRKAGTSSWTQTGTPFRSTLHQIQVNGLEPFGRYEFAVRSRACNGLETTDDNANRGYALFAEPYYPPDLDKIHAIPSIEETTIGWITDVDTDGVVAYGTSPDLLGQTVNETDEEGETPEPGRTHEVSLSELKPCTTYYFRVSSTNRLGSRTVGPILAFTTPSETTRGLAPIETFDTGLGKWTVTSSTTTVPETEAAVPRTAWAAIGGSVRTAIAGAVPGYISDSDTRLISPPFTTSGGLLELNFTEMLHSESGFDFATVEYSTDGGKGWVPVRKISGFSLDAPGVGTITTEEPSGSTLPRDVKVLIPGIEKGAVQIGFRFSSDQLIEVQPGWSIDNVVLNGVVPCPTTTVRTAKASATPRHDPSFQPVPLVGPAPARSARGSADAHTVGAYSAADPRSRAAGSAVCVNVAGARFRAAPGIGTTRGETLPATGVSWAWIPGTLLIVVAVWMHRRVVRI